MIGLGLGLFRNRAAGGTISPFAGFAAAYSLRLPAGVKYVGAPWTVRRSSDNAELAINAKTIADANGNRWIDSDAVLGHVYGATTSILGTMASGYTAFRCALTAGSPTGWNTLIEDSTIQYHRANKFTSSLTAGVAYQHAVIVRRTGPAARNITLLMFASGGPQLSYIFNLDDLSATRQSTGFTDTSALVAPITYLGEAAWLCVMRFTPTVTRIYDAYHEITSGATRTYQGDGASGLIMTTPGIFTAADLNAFFTRMGDMTGQGRDGTQTDPTKQYQVVANGVYLGCLYASTAATMNIPVASTLSAPLVFNAVVRNGRSRGETAGSVIGSIFNTFPITLGSRIWYGTELASDALVGRFIGANNAPAPALTLPPNQFSVLTVTKATGLNSNLVTARLNGGDASTFPANPLADVTITSMTIGNPNVSNGACHDFDEICIATSLPTDQQRQTLERSQGAAFGITVA